MIEKRLAFKNDAESANRFCYWLMNELLGCKTCLQEVKITNYGLKAIYISAFNSIYNTELYYFVHIFSGLFWQ